MADNQILKALAFLRRMFVDFFVMVPADGSFILSVFLDAVFSTKALRVIYKKNFTGKGSKLEV